MKIRNRLTYLFITIVAFIIFVLSISIYFFSADFREDEFFRRLENRAISTAQLLIQVEEVNASLLRIIEQNTQPVLPSEKLMIFDFENIELFSTDEDTTLAISGEMMDEVRLNEKVRYYQDGFEIVGILFADKYDRFVVFAAAIDEYGLRKLRNLKIILVIGFIISIAVVSISGWFFAGNAISPISSVVKQVENITISSLDLRVDEGNGKDEIAQLAHTFNLMLTRLEKAVAMQKNFIANASHEFRTPLTAITGQLEVVLLKERKAKDYQKTIQSVLEDIERLSLVSHRLLLLAQASSDTARLLRLNTRVDDLLWQARSELLKRNPNYVVNVVFDLPVEDEMVLMASCNDFLMKSAFINLIENGCKYSENRSSLVTLSLSEHQQLCIKFSDTGSGIGQEDLKYVFEPFYRGKNAINKPGHGIGLSLVEKIVGIHGGSISVESILGQGSVFTILLPLSH